MKRGNWYHNKKMRAYLKAEGNPICPVCGEPIDYELDWYVDPKDGKRKRHPDSFEYDHVVEHWQGGDNSRENAQAVHRKCNVRKHRQTKRRQSALNAGKTPRDPSEPSRRSREW